MKRGMDEKSMGPMFPRLHVNDTEKGGPRAPPRNKMALYEQLSIPSQTFSRGPNPNKPNQTKPNPGPNPNPTPNYAPLPSSSSQGGVSGRGSFFPLQQPPTNAADKKNNRHAALNNQLMQQEQKKKQEDDDFMVPILVQQSGINLDHNENHQNEDNESLSPFSSAFSGRLTNVQKGSERNNSQDIAKSASNQSSRQSTKIQLKETNGCSSFGHRNASNYSAIRLQSNGNSQDHVVDSQADNNVSNETIRAMGYGNPSVPVRDVRQEALRSPNDPSNGDDVSEASMVDSISGDDISPDDVVGIIGQKHFWKARRAIVNQQRVFSVQVFELHRLIKVQRLIAGLPQLMVEDALLGRPAKVSPIKKVPVLKPSTNVPKLKDYQDKPKDDSREFSAEKASLCSVQNSSRSTFSGYPLPPSNPKMGSWSLNQPPGHQWLIPVMSPSEGLIYKPYPGPGYMSPGPGPPASAPVIGHNFVNHGVPPPYQWPPGFHPLVSLTSHGYFPPYGMTTMNPSRGEQMNPFNLQHHVPTVANNSEVQVSTASSPSNRRQDEDALPLFPTCPPADGGAEPARVIRVVPHNARSATESVARIFQFIQEERKQQDPV